MPTPGGKAYSFPIREAPESPSGKNTGPHRLKALSEEISADTSCYSSVREEWCALHLSLNLAGIWATGFRPWPKVRPKPGSKFTADEDAIHRDRLVIELHWLYARKEWVETSTAKIDWSPLFDHAAPFNFELAEKFALQNWSDDYRAKQALCLSPAQEAQLYSLRSNKMRDYMASFRKTSRDLENKVIPSPEADIKHALGRWRAQQPTLGDSVRHIARAEARYYLGKSAKPSQIAQLAGFILGEKPQDGKTVMASLKKLDEWIAARQKHPAARQA